MSLFKKINWQYAIGEILIVILGISIAFGLNNWAASRNDEKQKIKYLQNIKKDLEADIIQLDTNRIELIKRSQHIRQIRQFIGRPNPRKDTLLPKLFNLPIPIDFRPRNITYQTLINSGDFKLIDDFELKTSIQEHYLEYEYILEVYTRQNIIVDKYVGDFFMKELNYQSIYRDRDYSFMDTSFFGNMIGAQLDTFMKKEKASENGIQRCRALITAINAELE